MQTSPRHTSGNALWGLHVLGPSVGRGRGLRAHAPLARGEYPRLVTLREREGGPHWPATLAASTPLLQEALAAAEASLLDRRAVCRSPRRTAGSPAGVPGAGVTERLLTVKL